MATPVLQAGSTQDGVQPSRDSLGITHSADLFHRDQTRFLNDILGVRPVTQPAHRSREQARPMALEQQAESGSVAGPDRVHELRVGRRSRDA